MALFLKLLCLENIFHMSALLTMPLLRRPSLSQMPSAAAAASFSRAAQLDVNSIISHWPRRRKQRCLVDGIDVYIYTLYGARFQPTAVTHKAKKGPISWPHSGSKGRTMAPTGLCNRARGHLTIINITF